MDGINAASMTRNDQWLNLVLVQVLLTMFDDRAMASFLVLEQPRAMASFLERPRAEAYILE